MKIALAKKNPQGVHVFYVLSKSGRRYTVQFIRRARMKRWDCTCPDFTFRRQLKGSHRFCKHIHYVTCTGASKPRA